LKNSKFKPAKQSEFKLEFKSANRKQKLEKNQNRKKKGEEAYLAEAYRAGPAYGPVKIPIRYRLTGGTHREEDRHLQPPISQAARCRAPRRWLRQDSCHCPRRSIRSSAPPSKNPRTPRLPSFSLWLTRAETLAPAKSSHCWLGPPQAQLSIPEAPWGFVGHPCRRNREGEPGVSRINRLPPTVDRRDSCRLRP
jgi:hypothetical protein